MPALAKVAPPGETLGLGRRETIYDSDVNQDGIPVDTLSLFESFNSFSNTAFVAYKKQKGVHTNLKGSNFLPTGYKFGAYRWRHRPHSNDEDACSLVNIIHFAEVRRIRNMSYCVINQDQSPYITANTNDLTSWADNERIAGVATTLTAAGAAAVTFVPTPGTDHEGRVLDVNGQPFVLSALERWNVDFVVPKARGGANNFSPTIPIVETNSFDGVLIRPSN